MTAGPSSCPSEDAVAFPFSGGDLKANKGTLISTGQNLIQQSISSVCSAIFSYSDGFELDTNLGSDSTVDVHRFETRPGAGSALIGYLLNHKDTTPVGVVGSAATLRALNPSLEEYSFIRPTPRPLALSIASLDYSCESYRFVSDYTSALETSRQNGIYLINSKSVNEAQHMSLLNTVLSTVVPSIHVYDGQSFTRSSKTVHSFMESTDLVKAYHSITESIPKGKLIDPVQFLQKSLAVLNKQLETDYAPFEYYGHASPEHVIVTFGSQESNFAAAVAQQLARSGERVGTVAVRVYSPFLDEDFLKVLPKSVKRIVVLGQISDSEQVQDYNNPSPLYNDVVVAITMGSNLRPLVFDHKYSPETELSPKLFAWYFDQLASGKPVVDTIPKKLSANKFSAVSSFDLLQDVGASEFVFWDVDDSKLAAVGSRIAFALSLQSDKDIQYRATYDNINLAGVLETQIRIADSDLQVDFPIDHADVIVVQDSSITKGFDILATAKAGAKVLLHTTDTTAEDLEKRLPKEFLDTLVSKNIELYLLDPNLIGDYPETGERTISLIFQLAFWKLVDPKASIDHIVRQLIVANGQEVELIPAILNILAEKTYADALRKFEIPAAWANSEDEQKPADGEVKTNGEAVTTNGDHHDKKEQVQLPTTAVFNALSPNGEKSEEEEEPQVADWTLAAKHLAFKEAYHFESVLRPDLSAKTYIVRVQENRRITPLSYDRNLFHIEFDISGTGLTYKIGEALGVHGRNDSELVDEFIKFYQLDPEELVEVPDREDPNEVEVRTIYQSLLENLDIFGKPPKKFYEGLAPFAKDETEKKHLETLGSADGAAELKKRTDLDFVTYADILQEFKSAHPGFQDLVQLVAPLKRREYSIASSQNMHPNSVHLLIVVVDWVDSKGRKRYGQCSRYLSELGVGQELVVSVKPSVMKLPPLTTQPIIMSGLGTGLAPFKAFVEERIYQREQGHEIGEIFLYLGSRHRREEYLYGELWEAFLASGILTHLGTAFSRDQPQKIYIQDRMRETLTELVDAFVRKNGAFYLCGPTWPVPDVTGVLEDVIVAEAKQRGETVDDLAKAIEDLKDQGRYVLEVY